MKPEEQRIAIAEACGYVREPFAKYCWMCPDGVSRSGDPESILPDYLSDLNAMHEAEKVLDETQCALYCEMLVGNEPINHACEADGYYFHATAAQRAEAFLRTLNLWKE